MKIEKKERVKASVNGQINEFTAAGFKMAQEYFGAVALSEISLSKPIELSTPLLIPKPKELDKPILRPAEVVKNEPIANASPVIPEEIPSVKVDEIVKATKKQGRKRVKK